MSEQIVQIRKHEDDPDMIEVLVQVGTKGKWYLAFVIFCDVYSDVFGKKAYEELSESNEPIYCQGLVLGQRE